MKKRLSKIISALCTIATMTLCFSNVQAAPLDNTENIDETKSYIIYSGDTEVSLYDDGGANEGWLRQGNYLDFDKSFSWKIEKNGENFYLKNEGTEWYVKGSAKELDSKYYVVSDKDNVANDKGEFLFEKVDGGYKIKSVEVDKYIIYGENQNYVTYTDDESKANVWQIEEKPEYNNLKDYIIYSNTKDNTLFDDGGSEVGWLRNDKYVEYADKFSWKIEVNETGFYLKNVGTSWYVKGNEKDLNSNKYVVSDKNDGSEKGSYLIERVKDGYKIKSLTNDKYIYIGQDRDYVTFTDNIEQASTWKIEVAPVYEKPEGSITLWENPNGTNYYRIPAIATTNDGTLLAVNDLRYNHASDLGNHRIDLLLKSSTNNGETWSEEVNLTQDYSSVGYGFGDAAIVADRESDKVLIIAATGDKGYWHGNSSYVSTREKPIKVSSFVSNDGGKNFSAPVDKTSQIYGLNESWTRLFVASGRIMQSRYIKVGEYYRIYAALLVGDATANRGNFVIYSDDFGDTWKLLGGTTSPVPDGDEAKVEELPNGNVVIASRTGSGRFINVFSYDKDDTTFSTGSWESSRKSLVLGNGSATNGETYIVYAKDTETNEYKYVALQSIPTLEKARKGVGIFFKEVNSTESTSDNFISGWSSNNFHMVQPLTSAYSTFSIQKDGKIAFFYEDRNRSGYDAEFISLDLKTITDGKYEMAFTGIGSKNSPYIVETKEQLEAVNGIFSDEKVNWLYNIAPENPVLDATETTENSAIITWNAAEDNGLTLGYNIYNSENELLNDTLITDQKFEIQNLNPGTEYTFSIKAVNKDGVESKATEIIFNTNPTENEESNEIEDPNKSEDQTGESNENVEETPKQEVNTGNIGESTQQPSTDNTITNPENQTGESNGKLEGTVQPENNSGLGVGTVEPDNATDSENKTDSGITTNKTDNAVKEKETQKTVEGLKNNKSDNKYSLSSKGTVNTSDSSSISVLTGGLIFAISALIGFYLTTKKIK